jgi:replicative DNA helicase
MRFSLEAEQSVIGGLLIDNKKIDDVLDVINSGDFYRADHKSIFDGIVKLHNASQPIDVITLSETLHEAGELERAGGLGYLVEIANNTPAYANVVAYSRIIADRAMEREITSAGQRICELGENPEIAVDDKLNTLHAEFAGLERNDSAALIEGFDSLLKAQVMDIDARFNNKRVGGLTVGLKAVDDRFGGIESDDLWILAARPSMGKTTLALNIADHVSKTKEVLIFSLEMGKEQLTKKLLSAASSIPYGVLRSGQLEDGNWPQLSAGVQKLKGRKIHIVDVAAIDVNRATAIARKFARNGNLGLIIVDYLQLMTCKSQSRFDEVSQVSRALKAMAKTTKTPVLALSQLSRTVESGNNKRPNNSHLRESGQIEQDADIITFIYRDEVYCPDTPDKGIAELITSKFRNGEVGTDHVSAKLQFSRFEDLSFEYKERVVEFKPRQSRGLD